MKRVISLALVLLMVLSLAACSGEDDEQLQALAEVYNRIAPVYNDIYDKAQENGWMEDAQTAAEINALSATLGPLGEALSEGGSDLESSNIEQGIAALEELEPALQELLERVSEPYGG